MAKTSPEAMFDKEVVDAMRREFEAADKDGDGQIDAREACELFAQSCSPGASADEIRRTAESLRHQLDTDRSGTISFDEYCFRFGRRYQMELNRRKRAGSAAPVTGDAEEALKQEREALAREREALRKEREALERERQSQQPRPEPTPQAPQRRPAGARVRIRGLQAAAELNGRRATVVRYDEPAGRYVVEVEGLGQKSLKPDNLEDAGAGSEFLTTAQIWLQKTAARVQVWAAGYEWWQLIGGAVLLVVVIGGFLQASGRHRAPPSRGPRGTPPGADPHFRESSEHYSHGHYDSYDDGYGYDSPGLIGQLLGGWGPLHMYILLGVLGYLCWKGIIPVHQMSWFQIYMLWNVLQSFMHTGRGFGRRRHFY